MTTPHQILIILTNMKYRLKKPLKIETEDGIHILKPGAIIELDGDDNTSSELLEQVKEKKGRWKPSYNEPYFFIDCGIVNDTSWENRQADEGNYSIGNMYALEEEAELALQRQKILVELQDLAEGFQPDWEHSDQRHWYIYYSHLNGEYEIRGHYSIQNQGAIYFETKEKARHAIDTLGKEKLDILFGIKH